MTEENKAVIGNENAITILSPVLESTNDMLKRNQFLTIGIIKLLCANECERNTKIVDHRINKIDLKITTQQRSLMVN